MKTAHPNPSLPFSKQHPWYLLPFQAINLLMLLSLVGCTTFQALLPTPTAAPTETATRVPIAGIPQVTPLPPVPMTEISFRVEVPSDTPAETTVYLALRDEVTGLALNGESLPMEEESQGEGEKRVFSLTLPFAVGSAVQYRYERQAGNITVAEHDTNGSPVRYRIYHVEGPGGVEDVVSRWTDTSFTGETGRIVGLAKDVDTGLPIPNLLVAAAGFQTLTESNGSFLLEGLPAGVHNLVAYAQDGSYRTFQQGARVAAGSTTPAEIIMKGAPRVNVVFVVELPAETLPVVPVRLAGNLLGLGNTFASLSGGISSLATNMPVMSSLPDGRFTLTLELPAGADVRYKYTLGDGFWNAEHTASGDFLLRQIIVPETTVLVEDTVATWRSSRQGPITFDVTAPENTPPGDSVSIQFNPIFGWTEPIPMWPIDQNRWAYILYSPLNLPGALQYRYCRNGQCGMADDTATAGLNSAGRSVQPGSEAQTLVDQVKAWAWLNGAPAPQMAASETINPRGTGFMAGVEFIPGYHPSWRARLPNILNDVDSLSANWLVLTPTWTYTRQNPPVLEPVTGQDYTWFDLSATIEQTKIHQLNPAVFPVPRFSKAVDEWWIGSSRDFSWWLVWFEGYRKLILHHAGQATQTGAPALILGGEWLNPALPNGSLSDGSQPRLPADAENRWRNLIAEVRQHYQGSIFWALPSGQVSQPPAFLDAVDGIYLLWSAPLGDPANGIAAMEAEAGRILDEAVLPLQTALNKPVMIAATYPTQEEIVQETGSLEPAPNLQAQADQYNALLAAINNRHWVTGLVARGYYPPAILQDPSSSIHGKPAAEVLKAWFPALLEIPAP